MTTEEAFPSDPTCPYCQAKIPWFFCVEILKGSKEFFDLAVDHIIGLMTECAFCHKTLVFALFTPEKFRIMKNEHWREVVANHQMKYKEKAVDVYGNAKPSEN